MDETIIDLKDLIYQIFRKWRAVLVWMLIFGVLMDGYGFYKKSQELKFMKTVAYREDMGEGDEFEEEIQAVEFALENYLMYEKEYRSKKKYYDNSILMQLDANMASSIVMEFLIDNHYQVEYPVIDKKDTTGNIITSYAYEIVSDEICKEIAKTLGEDIKAKYLKELISVYGGGGDILTIKILGRSQKECESIADGLKKQMGNVTERLKGIYGDFDVTPIGEKYSQNIEWSVLDSQKNMITALSDLKGRINTVTKDLTEEQKTYYKKLLDVKLQEDAELREAVGVKEEQKKVTSVSILQLKYFVIGLLLGAFLVCAVVAMSYLLGGTVRVKSDITDTFHLMLLGTVSLEEEKKKRLFSFIDRFIDKLFYGKGAQFTREEQINMVSAGIHIAADKEAMKKLFVTGSCNDEESERIRDVLLGNAEKAGVSAEKGVSIVHDPDSLCRLAKADGVVLVERVGQSLYKDIEREMELCKKYSVAVIGCVLVEK